MTIELNGASLQEGAMDGLTLLEVYVGAEKIWPTGETVQIMLGTYREAYDQLQAALTARGLNPQTVTEIPFDIELVGTGSTSNMFFGCYALTTVPEMDTSQVTDMSAMFYSCISLTSVPDLDTSQVTDMSYMFSECISLTTVPAMDTSQVTDMSYMFDYCPALTSVPDMDTSNVTDMDYMFRDCSALTDGNVRLIGRHPQVDTAFMIEGSGLTREPFYTAGGGLIEVYEVSVTDVSGTRILHPLLTVTVPAGETWSVRIQGTVTMASDTYSRQPEVRIGGATFGPYAPGAAVDCSGTVTSADTTIAVFTHSGRSESYVSFVGTVTIEK